MSNFNIENTVNIKHMFYECESLEKIDLSNLNPKKVTRMEYMFYKCPNLEYIDISQFELAQIKIVDMFNNLPDKGLIRIKQSLYERIQDDIPSDWEVSFAP